MASTVTAGLAGFVGHLDVPRIVLFGFAGLFAAATTLVAPAALKKKPSACG